MSDEDKAGDAKLELAVESVFGVAIITGVEPVSYNQANRQIAIRQTDQHSKA